MRSNAGGCTLQQALTPAAAMVVKEAVTLARRRGHAQVTPLHVASTMLSSSSSSGLLRAACQQSHTHPLQCRALELCFNVALNRLSTTASSSSPPMSPMLGPPSLHHHHYQQQQQQQSPAISNALVAAFKRAQAHQRRGTVETQQQQLLAVKIELEQLVVSILDDPSVSRVMKEAGFSSTLVKAKVQQAVASIEVSNSTSNRDSKSSSNTTTSNGNKGSSDHSKKVTAGKTTSLISGVISSKSDESQRRTVGNQVTMNEDALSVIEGLLATVSKRKSSRTSSCVVVIGDSLAILEAAVGGAIGMVERSDRSVPYPLREVKFVPIHLGFIEQLTREGIEKKVEEIRSIVTSYAKKGGVVLYLGDLDRWASYAKLRADVEHMIMELRRLVLDYYSDNDDSVRLWLLGVAKSTQRSGQANSDLEGVWGTPLHAVTIPAAGSLGLSLNPDSDLLCSPPDQRQQRSNLLMHEGIKEDKPQTNSLTNRSCNSEPAVSSSVLPSWLQKCINKDYQQDISGVTIIDQSKRWISSSADSSLCTSPLTSPSPSQQQCFQRTLSFTSSTYPPPSGFSYGQLSFQPTTLQSGSFWLSGNQQQQHCSKPFVTSFKTYNIPDPTKDQTRSPLSPILPNYSTSSSENLEIDCTSTTTPKLFKDYTVENVRTICGALERMVPWQMDIIPDIVSTILHCRGGSRMRRSSVGVINDDHLKEETWLFFQGADMDGKQKIARELAGLIFGSREKFVSIGISNFSCSPMATDSMNKRSRDERNCSYLERLSEEVSRDPHRVFFLEDIDQVDYCSQVGIKRAAERGKLKMSSSNGEDDLEVGFGDAIIILSCDKFSSRSRGCSPNMNHHHLLLDHHGEPIMDVQDGRNTTVEELTSPSLSLDLNLSISDDHGSNSVVDDDDCHYLSSLDEIGLVSSVDKCVVFKLREL